MNDKKINMLWLYPDLLNLHGDRGNIMAFKRMAEMLGLQLNIQKIENLTDMFELNDIDIIFLNPGELGTAINAIKALNFRKEELIKYVQEGKYIIAIGTSGAILAKEIHTLDKQVHHGLGLIDMDCRQRETVIGDDIYYAINSEQEIIGSQIQMLDFKINNDNALGETAYGYGNMGNGYEGGKNKNAIFTNALGPVFVKNPWWTEEILTDIAEQKGFKTNMIQLDNYEIEIKSFNSTKKFIENKSTKTANK